jgi:hypothetical protein
MQQLRFVGELDGVKIYDVDSGRHQPSLEDVVRGVDICFFVVNVHDGQVT